jgi:hypothetical protein
MESQQMMELLLAMNEKMDANTKAMKTMQERAEINRRIDREHRKADMEEILYKMEERMTATQDRWEA